MEAMTSLMEAMTSLMEAITSLMEAITVRCHVRVWPGGAPALATL